MPKKILKLNNGETILDEEDLTFVNQWHWWFSKTGYVRRKIYIGGKPKIILLHRILLNAPKDMQVDHINGNRLDNRKSNLRLVTLEQNRMNRGLNKNNKSGYKGVFWYKPLYKWCAYITVNTKRRHLGYFRDKKEAAFAYNKAAFDNFGEFARLNII